MDTSVEVLGDVIGPIRQWLVDESIGIIGPWGLLSENLQHFHEEIESGDADAMQAYCIAFRRAMFPQVGLMRRCSASTGTWTWTSASSARTGAIA